MQTTTDRAQVKPLPATDFTLRVRAPTTREISATRGAAYAHCSCARDSPQDGHHASDSGSFTKAEIAREDVLQSSEMIRHGRGGQNLKCRIPPASNSKKKQEFA
jgi:hypothetical protein